MHHTEVKKKKTSQTPLGSTAWISSVALHGWLAPSRFKARTLYAYHWPSIRPVTWHFSSGTMSPQGSHLSVPLWQRSTLYPRMLLPPSYLGGSQVRKMPLADLSLHFRFSGGSETAVRKLNNNNYNLYFSFFCQA